MRKIQSLPVVILLAVGLACNSTPTAKPGSAVESQNRTENFPVPNISGNATPSPDTAKLNDPELIARYLISTDDGKSGLADANDIRVKRARYLIGVLVNQTKEEPSDIGFGAAKVSESIQNRFGRPLTQLAVLEDMAAAYSKGLVKKKDGKFVDAAMLWALLKYGK